MQNSNEPIRIINIAILAHVDAGKTTLSERILFTAHEIRRPGKVEDGLATMDYLPEEKDRGITIESGVAHFEWKGVWFNFIDTPGHIDFGAEVDMALTAVEGAVLIVSAASGVETQTIAAYKKLRAAGVRTLIFINKLDNADYSLDETLINIEETLGVRPVLMSFPEYCNKKIVSEIDVLSKSRLTHTDIGEEIVDAQNGNAEKEAKKYYDEAIECASNFDDSVLKLAIENRNVQPKILLAGLQKLAASDNYALCYAGSALDGFGVRSLVTALTFFLPSVKNFSKTELGQVIRLRYFKGIGEISLFRSHATLLRKDWPEGFEFSRLKANLLCGVDEIFTGDIYAMRAPFKTELGQIINVNGTVNCTQPFKQLYQPLLQTRIECETQSDYAHVESSLNTLNRMDPSFNVQYDNSGFWYMRTIGEVQLDVLLARLKREFNCTVKAGTPEIRWQERLSENVGPVENTYQIGPHKIYIKLSAKPLENRAHDIRLSAEFLENAPREILAGVRSALLESTDIGILGKGGLFGVCFFVHNFTWTKDALPPMIKKACLDAVTKLIKPSNVTFFEPIMELSLECPANFAGTVTGDIQARLGKIKETGGDGKTHFLKAEIPLKNVFGYATKVRSISKGTAIYSMKFLEYRAAASFVR